MSETDDAKRAEIAAGDPVREAARHRQKQMDAARSRMSSNIAPDAQRAGQSQEISQQSSGLAL